MGIIDIISLLIIGFTAIAATNQNIWSEFISLLSLAGGYLIYRFSIIFLLQWLNITFPFSLAIGIIWLVSNVLLLSYIIHRITQNLRDNYQKNSMDTLIGLCLGGTKGYLIMLVMISLTFNILVDKEALTDNSREAKEVPAFLYQAKSYHFWKSGYLALGSAWQSLMPQNTSTPILTKQIVAPTAIVQQESNKTPSSIQPSSPTTLDNIISHTAVIDDSNSSDTTDVITATSSTTPSNISNNVNSGLPEFLTQGIENAVADDKDQLQFNSLIITPTNSVDSSKSINTLDDLILRELH